MRFFSWISWSRPRQLVGEGLALYCRMDSFFHSCLSALMPPALWVIFRGSDLMWESITFNKLVLPALRAESWLPVFGERLPCSNPRLPSLEIKILVWQFDVFFKSKTFTIRSSKSIPRYLPRRNENIHPHKDLYVNIHDSSNICKSQKVEIKKHVEKKTIHGNSPNVQQLVNGSTKRDLSIPNFYCQVAVKNTNTYYCVNKPQKRCAK